MWKWLEIKGKMIKKSKSISLDFLVSNTFNIYQRNRQTAVLGNSHFDHPKRQFQYRSVSIKRTFVESLDTFGGVGSIKERR